MKAPSQRSASADTTVSAAALVFCSAATLCWLACWLLPTESLLPRAIVGLVSLGLSAILVRGFWQRTVGRQRLAQLYLARLAEQGRNWPSSGTPDPPPLEPRSPWAATLAGVRELLSIAAERLTEAEHARSVLELRLRRSAAHAERLKRVVESLPEPVIAVDKYDDVWLTNTSAEKLLGLPPERPDEKRTLAQLAHCERLVALLDDTRRRKVATTRSDEVVLPQADGAQTCYRVVATGLLAGSETGDGAEAVEGVMATMRDVSLQKTMQRSHAEFVSAASHEMKAPLAGIKAYVELLADGDAEDEQQREEFLQVINGQADRLQRLIDNLLNLARIEAGVVQVSKQPRPLNEILQEACGVVRPAADAKQIQLSEQLSPMYLGVLADRDMLLQAAINLLSNAVKYTQREGRVTLRSRLLDGEIQFEVEDTGVGLSSDDCQLIFGKFYRVARNKDMAAGTGLGLPLAKYIVEDVHGGSLTVASTLGVGSTFTVNLSAAKSSTAASAQRGEA